MVSFTQAYSTQNATNQSTSVNVMCCGHTFAKSSVTRQSKRITMKRKRAVESELETAARQCKDSDRKAHKRALEDDTEHSYRTQPKIEPTKPNNKPCVDKSLTEHVLPKQEPAKPNSKPCVKSMTEHTQPKKRALESPKDTLLRKQNCNKRNADMSLAMAIENVQSLTKRNLSVHVVIA